MEISNGIRGLRLHREQPQQQQPTAAKDSAVKAPNGAPLSAAPAHKMVRSPKPLIARKIRSLFGRSQPTTVRDLFMDERFLAKFFMFFSAMERGALCQVCKQWKNILYHPRYWITVVPIVPCRELAKKEDVRRFYYDSLQHRSFDSICLFGATDDDIIDFISHFSNSKKQLRSVGLRCSNITDSGLEALFKKMAGIYRLELSGCNELTETGLWSCLNPKIVSLSVSDCINVADDTVGAVSQLLPSLYEFNLQAYHVTDAALAFFSAKQSYTLCILRLQSCWEITNHGIVNIVHSLPNLTILSLSGCSKITDDGVELIAENLRKLRFLDLSWCPRVTDAALEYIACDLNQLEELILDRFVQCCDDGRLAPVLKTIFHQCAISYTCSQSNSDGSVLSLKQSHQS